MLDRLAALRLIGRQRDTEDRRHVTATITPKGLEVLDAVRPAVDAMERSRFSRLSERTLMTLIEGLAAVRDSA
jgi:DNA-binding MarR family transcriptional regulator